MTWIVFQFVYHRKSSGLFAIQIKFRDELWMGFWFNMPAAAAAVVYGYSFGLAVCYYCCCCDSPHFPFSSNLDFFAVSLIWFWPLWLFNKSVLLFVLIKFSSVPFSVLIFSFFLLINRRYMLKECKQNTKKNAIGFPVKIKCHFVLKT